MDLLQMWSRDVLFIFSTIVPGVPCSAPYFGVSLAPQGSHRAVGEARQESVVQGRGRRADGPEAMDLMAQTSCRSLRQPLPLFSSLFLNSVPWLGYPLTPCSWLSWPHRWITASPYFTQPFTLGLIMTSEHLKSHYFHYREGVFCNYFLLIMAPGIRQLHFAGFKRNCHYHFQHLSELVVQRSKKGKGNVFI